MKTPLQVLIVEDCDADAMLLLHELKRGGYDLKHLQVCTRPALEAALRDGPWDIIFSDFAMPSFDGLTALEMVKASGLDLPFILVSGTVGEERAVAAMKAGASDYLMKGRLGRLVPAVQRELRDADTRRQQRQSQESLRQSEERFTKLFHTSPVAMILTTVPEGKIVEINDTFLKVFGFAKEQVMGQLTMSLGLWVEPADREKFLRELVQHGRVVNFEAKLRRHSGEPGDFLLSSEVVEVTGVKCALSLLHDLTDKKRAEAQALRGQRLESIGTLSAGIAHDLNNALAPILMSIDLLRSSRMDPGDQAILDTLASSTQRAANMVGHVLTFTRGLSGEHTAVPLTHLLKDINSILRQTLPKNIQLKTTHAKGLWLVSADATQLHQVLTNLSINARDAMPHGGNLTIWAENVTLDDQFARMCHDAKPGPHVHVSVKDTGTGMSPAILDRIFEPFFTTKPVGKGTGLGLPSVRDIVQKHGGCLLVRSEVGKGTEFSVYLPALPAADVTAEAEEPAPLPMGRGETVLLADDESAIRDITSQTLRMHNYEVIAAADGARALSAFTGRQNEVRVLLTDLNMPILDGIALIRVLRDLQPGIRVIVSSSPMEDQAGLDPLQLGADACLSKPYTAQQLLTTVRDVLDRD